MLGSWLAPCGALAIALASDHDETLAETNYTVRVRQRTVDKTAVEWPERGENATAVGE